MVLTKSSSLCPWDKDETIEKRFCEVSWDSVVGSMPRIPSSFVLCFNTGENLINTLEKQESFDDIRILRSRKGSKDRPDE